MRPLMIRSSLLIISVLLGCASTLAARHADGAGSPEGLEKFAPLSQLEASLLFKAAIEIRGSYFSGLVLIKEIAADSTIHVVFLSELGLNLLDMAYKNEEFQVESVQEFLNRPAILKTLKGDFRSILLDLSLIVDYKISSKGDGTLEELKFRHKGQRYKYSYSHELGCFQVRKTKGVFGRVDYTIRRQETLTIGIRHRCFRLNMDLRELNKLENNGH